MKKIYLFIIALIVCVDSSAQTKWDILGNTGTNATTDYVGTTDPTDLSFRTNGSMRMQLKQTGELGIGVTSTSSWLHVKSTGTKETFRTDVPANYDNYWRMFRNGTEYGRFINFDNAFALQNLRFLLLLFS